MVKGDVSRLPGHPCFLDSPSSFAALKACFFRKLFLLLRPMSWDGGVELVLQIDPNNVNAHQDLERLREDGH
jgi:hypothetical protein